ncbi:substrate-binding domain-containing protein [Gordonia neofelifaecis]|uniref:Extracellular solute-binding protein n=1 Tax=Gordonia neofelifaecis NRRL B-59395 TaxID=644548 RepID=F1YP44_9ACTN|nr:substrate-binding domain-containing protein [Gordonia neofelifaecis]EGD53549.1 hypothetical protein SCNU_18532 [Gordonia neofelifaecis NRRL B-59395]
MAKHNSGERSRHYVSRPLVAFALALILVAGIVTAWRQLGDQIDDEQPVAASECLDGPAKVSVLADPAIAPGLQKIAESFDATKPIVRDHCITVEVRPADARATLEGLTAKDWDAQTYGEFPAAWIPESSIWSAALQTAKPDALQGQPESLVSSPIRLAMEPEIAKAGADQIAWAELPDQTKARSLAQYGRASWGSMRIAMPTGPQSDATALGAQAVAAATVPTQQSLTLAQAQSPPVVGALDQLMSAPPKVGDGSIDAAVRSIADTTDPADAPVRAVSVTEQHLYVLTKDDQTARVAAVAPKGPTPVADYPVVKLAGPLVPAHVSDAISQFITFARKPPQMEILTRAGFRGSGPLPAPTATIGFGEVTDQMPLPEPAASVAVSKIVYPAAAL